LEPVCGGCHNGWGVAKDTDFVLVPTDAPEAVPRNYQALLEVARLDIEGIPLVVAKPSGATSHGGGTVLAVESAEYDALMKMVSRIRSETDAACAQATTEDPAIFDGVRLADPAATLRRATITLAGRLPTTAELGLLNDGGWAALDIILGRVLREDAFYEVLREVFNDLLLTDKYMGGREALQLLDKGVYPDAEWMFEEDAYQRADGDEDLLLLARTHANRAVAREAIELIEFIVRNDRPFTEILTADYTLLNPFSAGVYGVHHSLFDDRYDPDEYRQIQLPGIPHAGILTSPMFLNRYPTTATNRNRHRAKVVYDYFLGLDVLKFAQRPIDLASSTHNPTLNDPQCNVCHEVVDPVAGAFKNWDESGSYRVPEAWHGDMLPPGFRRIAQPLEAGQTSLQWLASAITADPRFDRAIVRIIYRGLSGEEPLRPPSVNDEYPEERARLFAAQTEYFERVGRQFRANGHDLRVVFKELVTSPWLRAVGVDDASDPGRAAQLDAIGLIHPLTPEALNRKLKALFSYPWRPNPSGVDYLTDGSEYKMLYGGIDSDDVIKRLRDPNGLMANIQMRMANEVACLVTARDFGQPIDERRLFPGIEPSFVPEDENGFVIADVEGRIRDTLVHLHAYLLGEAWESDAPEIEAAWLLWDQVWRGGRDAVVAQLEPPALPTACRYETDYWSGEAVPEETRIVEDGLYTVRAWMAVISYLLLDYRFLYQ